MLKYVCAGAKHPARIFLTDGGLVKMKQAFYGVSFFLVGLGLICFNKVIAKHNKAINELFGMGSPSIQLYRVVTYVAGAALTIVGAILLVTWET